MPNENMAVEVGHAWGLQRSGNADAAIKEYEAILQKDPDNIDANYGMGLAQRLAGNNENAVKFFRHSAELVDAGAKARNHTPGERNLPEDDRYLMLGRMLQQRLAELNAGTLTSPM